MEAVRDGAGVRFPPPLIYLAGLALGIFAGRQLDLAGIGLGTTGRELLGGALALLGVIIMFAGAGLLVRRKTAVIPFKPATCLVTGGIYKFTRNPMYLGMALAYAALAMLFDSIAALILLPLVLATIQTQVIAREEAYLSRRFGDDYVAYKRGVRRWI